MKLIRLPVLLIAAGWLMSCTPDEAAQDHQSAGLKLPLTFAWPLPSQTQVVETLEVEGRRIKVGYRLRAYRHESMPNHVTVSFSDVTPLALDDTPVALERLSDEEGDQVRRVMSEFYGRPSVVMTGDGVIVRVVDIERSIRRLVNLSYPRDVPAQVRAFETARANQALRSKVETSAYNVMGCVLTPWLNFAVPLNERVSQPIQMVLVDGAQSVEAQRTLSNLGYVDGEAIRLRSETQASGTDLARVMLDLTYRLEKREGALPDLEGVATASRTRVSEIVLDPATLRPVWARCTTDFEIQSSDASLLPPTSNRRAAEYEFTWQ